MYRETLKQQALVEIKEHIQPAFVRLATYIQQVINSFVPLEYERVSFCIMRLNEVTAIMFNHQAVISSDFQLLPKVMTSKIRYCGHIMRSS